MTVDGDDVLLLIYTKSLVAFTDREIAVQEDEERYASRRLDPMSLPNPLVNFGGDCLLVKHRVWSVCEAIHVGVDENASQLISSHRGLAESITDDLESIVFICDARFI